MMPTQHLAFSGRLGAFALVCLQLVLILVVAYQFDVEAQKPFFPMLCLAAAGFVVHAWLPRRFRTGFFILLSLAAMLFVLGWPNGVWLIGIGGGLIALCYLPVPMAFRVLLVAVAGVLLFVFRAGSEEPFWPVLGSMFMFRLIVYLYEIRHERGRPPLGHTLAYFFPLPNVCFTLFPVLDFKTFRETYYNEDEYTIYQTGVAWIVRGLSHLLVYRLVKYYILPSPHELRDLGHLALFVAANYALYLRVSGWFHLITGLLHLFGFNLPRTHYNYFLASSFTDIWRRINIYWKDFMTNVFFFPTFFGLRQLSTRTALVLATLGVFVATWLLHSYQVFWLLGDLSLRWNDAVLWLTVGVLATVNMQFDLRRAVRATHPSPPTPLPGGERGEEGSPLPSAEGGANSSPLSPPGRGVGGEGTAPWWTGVFLSLRIVGMFVLVSFFWACWTIPGFVKLVSLPGAFEGDVAGAAGTLLLILAAAVVVGALAYWTRGQLSRRGLLSVPFSFHRSAAIHACGLALVILVALPQVAGVLGPDNAEVVAVLRRDSFTLMEAKLVVRGYYEEIAEAPVQSGPWLGALTGKARPAADQGALYTDLTRPADDLLERELIPGWKGKVLGNPLSINSQGMRDREGIAQHKPANTCRIALVGSSVVMGYGVADEEVFSRLLEARLNAAAPPGGPHYEVLNFGTGKSHAIHRRALIDRKVFDFEPDALYVFAHQDELFGPAQHLARLFVNKSALPYPCLQEVLRKANLPPDTAPGAVEARLLTFGPEIVEGIYRGLVEDCRKRGIVPVWVYVPMPGVVEVSVKTEEVVAVASRAGFVVVNLAHWADGRHPAEVKITPSDHHPNALGHRLIAEQLFEVMRQRPELLPASARLK
jgi:D-alanyl-lipoteichoic acid acyltransferase DltB (MBOAT superfamily)